ncbi:MAG: YcxB family protein [Chloroflexota bacterium]
MTPDRRYEIEFEMTADGIAEASRLFQRRQYLLIGAAGIFELGIALLLVAIGADIVIAIMVAVVGLFSLALTQTPVILKWRIGRMARSILGTTAKAEIDSTGFKFTNSQSSAHIEWNGLTDVRENDKIVLLVRDRRPYAWIPAAAFGTPERREEIVSFMRAHIAAAHPARSDAA